jgi:hypothetical protein
MRTVATNVFEPGAFNPETQYCILLFNKISLLCGQQPGGDEASNERCNSGPDFIDNSNVVAQSGPLVWECPGSKDDLQNIIRPVGNFF